MKIETALLLIPPLDVQAYAAPLRARLDPQSFPLFPAHITLMYPFVPYQEHAQAERVLREHCLHIPPFDITLDHFDRFPSVLFIAPRDPEPIRKLYRCISSAFPGHVAYGGAFGDDLHPHLTLGGLDPELAQAEIDLPPIPPMTFTIDRLYFYAGIADAEREGPVPFIPLSVIPLEG